MNQVSAYIPFYLLQSFDGTVTTLQVTNPTNLTQGLESGLDGTFKGRNVLETVPPDTNITTYLLDEVKHA